MKSLNELASEAPIVMFYFFSEDCAPCLALRKKMKDLLDEHFPNIPLVLLDGRKYPTLMQENFIASFPTAIVFADGKEFRRYGLYSSIHSITQDIERLVKLMEV